MPDQADELRRFVAEQNVSSLVFHDVGEAQAFAAELLKPHALTSLPPETAEVYSPAAVDELRQMVKDAAAPKPGEIRRRYDERGNIIAEASPFGAEETAVLYDAKLGRRAPSLTDDLITYRRLWLDLKVELEAEADGAWVDRDGGQDVRPHGDPDRATESRRVLDRVLQMETLAFYAHVPPATGETWESVREGLRVKG